MKLGIVKTHKGNNIWSSVIVTVTKFKYLHTDTLKHPHIYTHLYLYVWIRLLRSWIKICTTTIPTICTICVDLFVCMKGTKKKKKNKQKRMRKKKTEWIKPKRDRSFVKDRPFKRASMMKNDKFKQQSKRLELKNQFVFDRDRMTEYYNNSNTNSHTYTHTPTT